MDAVACCDVDKCCMEDPGCDTEDLNEVMVEEEDLKLLLVVVGHNRLVGKRDKEG